MATIPRSPDSLSLVRSRIGERIAEIEQRASTLKPIDIRLKMDAIRAMAAEHGLLALEGLADYSAHHAMMPGHRQATRCALDHMSAALDSNSDADRTTILAAMAIRLH
ncbi:hypothetical protein [Sphingomonas sp.]|uniref:hypothetical protein n=1 Tax=Sphingomonas sp. TaxID=28214 RepID=UPI00286A2E50|nr:hypothetical protein [Sphingomonas sp.]